MLFYFELAIYYLFILIYPKVVGLVALLGNKKAKEWIKGRNNWQQSLQLNIAATNKTSRIWIHCASLGEFEQAKPIIEKKKAIYKDLYIVVTFFSPSGYKNVQSYHFVDYFMYLPMDNHKNATRFLQILQPKMALFIKYEFWYFYLKAIHHQNIPLFLVSGIFRKNQTFFKWYGAFHKSMLHCFTHFFVQDNTSIQLLDSIGMKDKTSISGDTRFDRVLQIASTPKPLKDLDNFIQQWSYIIVAGSTWFADDSLLSSVIKENLTVACIVAPHNIDEDRLKQCLDLYPDSILFSHYKTLKQEDAKAYRTIIIDNIGMLSSLYSIATIAFIGGGFAKTGIHNVLEAAVYGKPIVFGNNFEKYVEARGLVNAEAAFPVESSFELNTIILQLLNNPELYRKAATAAKSYVIENAGATQTVFSYLQKLMDV